MPVSKDVLLDLLPIYLAGEAREGTRALMEQHLARDHELSRIAEKMKATRLPNVPPTAAPDQEMRAFARAKHLMFQRIMFLILAVASTVFWAFSMGFMLDSRPEAAAVAFVLTAIFWVVYSINSRRISNL